jgi:hypothetical protein
MLGDLHLSAWEEKAKLCREGGNLGRKSMDYIQGIFSLSPAGLQVLILADITTPT